MATVVHQITTLVPNAGNPHTNFNLAMFKLDALTQMSAISILDAPPGSNLNGVIYLIDYTPNSQDFSGKGDNIALYIDISYPEVIQEWLFVEPVEGMQVFLENDNVWLYYRGGYCGHWWWWLALPICF